MRILWFVNAPFPEAAARLGLRGAVNGSWLTSAAAELVAEGGVELGIVWAGAGVMKAEEFTAGGVTYYCLPECPTTARIAAKLRPAKLGELLRLLATHSLLHDTSTATLRACAAVAKSFRPDLIHVHGTERFYGLLPASVPVLISIQGLLHEIAPRYWGDATVSRRIASPLSAMLWLDMRGQARRELRILRSNHYFSGRTDWDRARVLAVNPSAQYHHVGEVLRPVFAQQEWRLDTCSRFTIYTTTTPYYYKGTATLLRALRALRESHPQVTLRIGGPAKSGDPGRELLQLCREMGIEDRVNFLGQLDAAGVARELVAAHVYVNPSWIENSPNSLGEAQVVGTPSVATNTGGIPSMLQDDETGLLFSPGDTPALVRQIRRLFADDACCQRLSHASRSVARRRHDPKVVIQALRQTYRDLGAVRRPEHAVEETISI